jgi:hypothetical protein
MKDFILKYYTHREQYKVTLVVKGTEMIFFEIDDTVAYNLERLGVNTEIIN